MKQKKRKSSKWKAIMVRDFGQHQYTIYPLDPQGKLVDKFKKAKPRNLYSSLKEYITPNSDGDTEYDVEEDGPEYPTITKDAQSPPSINDLIKPCGIQPYIQLPPIFNPNLKINDAQWCHSYVLNHSILPQPVPDKQKVNS